MTEPTPKSGRVLVTGLTGLIGGRVAAYADDFELASLSVEDGVDIREAKSIRAVADDGPPAVGLIHLAAFTDVSAAHQQSGDRDGDCYTINVVGTERIAEYCAERQLPWVYLSTDFVFAGDRDAPYEESDPPSPIEWYGETKSMAEDAARAAGGTVVRIGFPYSPQPAPKPDLVQWIRTSLADGKELTLFDDQVICPTFADDIARGLIDLVREPARGATFHLSSCDATTPYGLAQSVAAAFDLDAALISPGSLEEYLKKDPRPRQRCLRLSNAEWRARCAERGLAAPLSVADGLAELRKHESAGERTA